MPEGDLIVDFFELAKQRRSIRRYSARQISKEDLKKIIEAGLYAPNAGGGQRTVIAAIHNRELCKKIGIMNLSSFNRNNLAGSCVSKEQPSVIDDPSIKNGFYGAPTVCAVFAPDNFLYSVPDAFCCAENMALAAYALGIDSCIIARGEETFNNPFGDNLIKKRKIPAGYTARCFVILGYHSGDYPSPKPRKANRSLIIE